MIRPALLVACAATIALAACGDAPKPVAKGPPPVGVFIGATDCAATGKLAINDCHTLIQQGIAMHQQTSRTYTSNRLCEEKEGPDRCERNENNVFRPKLLAFMITFSTPVPSVIPLYPLDERNAVGFVSGDKGRKALIVDEALIFSDQAKVIAENYILI
jgi:Protein of unknown function (DUF1190)